MIEEFIYFQQSFNYNWNFSLSLCDSKKEIYEREIHKQTALYGKGAAFYREAINQDIYRTAKSRQKLYNASADGYNKGTVSEREYYLYWQRIIVFFRGEG